MVTGWRRCDGGEMDKPWHGLSSVRTAANRAAGPLVNQPLISTVVRFPQATAKLLCWDDMTMIS